MPTKFDDICALQMYSPGGSTSRPTRQYVCMYVCSSKVLEGQLHKHNTVHVSLKRTLIINMT